MLTAIALLVAGTMTFPLGVVDIPEGCRGAARVPWRVDFFMESIVCEGGFTVHLYGGLHISTACDGLPPGTKGTQGAPDNFLQNTGSVLPVCAVKRRAGSKQEREETRVDLGGAGLSAEIQTKKHLSILREIALSFRRGKNGNAQ